jgi:hypothetical protein
MTKRAAIVRWTGRGVAAHLESSVRFVLKDRGVAAKLLQVGGSLVVAGPEPVGVCSMFENMPGVAWTAAGYLVEGPGDLARASSLLAASYLRRGTKFAVLAETTGGGRPSDLAGAVTSAMLEKARGSRASADSPEVRFRAALDGEKGVVGVELARGPGGSPTGGEMVACLVSGGRHSSVVAYCALLRGYRVRLVHASTGEAGLYAVARLYAELSNRADPRGLSLEVLEGGSPAGMLAAYAAGSSEEVYAGFTPDRPAPGALADRAQSPLYLMPEESFASEFGGLHVKGDERVTDWGDAGASSYQVRGFGGRRADVSQVIDGLSSKPPGPI